MPKFELDTGGAVHVIDRDATGAQTGGAIIAFRDLDAFTQGYIEALFFTEGEPGTDRDSWNPETDSSLPGDVGFADLAPEALQSIAADCLKFQTGAEWQAFKAADVPDYDDEQGGRDLWFTRNGHGVGFCDREALAPQGDEWDSVNIPLDQWTADILETRARLKGESWARRLDTAARIGEVWTCLGDDGLVYLE